MRGIAPLGRDAHPELEVYLAPDELLDPLARSLADPLSGMVTMLLVLVTLAAIELSLGLVFDPAARDFHYAALTAPVLSLLIVALVNPRGHRRETAAELIFDKITGRGEASREGLGMHL